MTDLAEEAGCACCSPAAVNPPSTEADQRGRFIAGVQQLDIHGEDLAELGELWDTGHCAAVRERVTQAVTTKLNATQAGIVELIEHAARLQAEATSTFGTPPSVCRRAVGDREPGWNCPRGCKQPSGR